MAKLTGRGFIQCTGTLTYTDLVCSGYDISSIGTGGHYHGTGNRKQRRAEAAKRRKKKTT